MVSVSSTDLRSLADIDEKTMNYNKVSIHNSSTGSTTISEACAIAAESNYGKALPMPYMEDKVDGVKNGHNHYKHSKYISNNDHDTLSTEHHLARYARHQQLRGRLVSMAHTTARSHSAGVPNTIAPSVTLSNNIPSSNKPMLPSLRPVGTNTKTSSTDSVLRVIKTAPVVSRLPPIGGVPCLGSATPVNRTIAIESSVHNNMTNFCEPDAR